MGLEGCLSPSDSISHNCRVGWVGRHHWRSSSPTSLAPAGSPWAYHSEMSPDDFWIPPQKDSATSLQPVPMSMRREDKGLLSSINYSALKDRVTLFCCCQSHILLFSHLLDSTEFMSTPHYWAFLCPCLQARTCFPGGKNHLFYTSFSQRKDWDQVLLLFSLYIWRNTFRKWLLGVSLQILCFHRHQEKLNAEWGISIQTQIFPELLRTASRLPYLQTFSLLCRA